jgi:26S proteasome regulatory subunit T1
VLKTYGAAPYAAELKKLEKEIKDKQQTINEKIGMPSTPLSTRPLLTQYRCQGS